MSIPFTILGSSGFIGSALASHLQSTGRQVLLPPREQTSLQDKDWGHVIYAIGLTADFRNRPFDTMEAHVGLLGRILRHGRFTSFTYLSSTRVYQNVGSSEEETPLSISVTRPGDLYNISKLAGESLCLHCGHPRVRVVRLSNVVGSRPSRDSFLEMVLEEAFRTGRVVLRSTPDSAKDYVALDDVVRLLPHLAEHATKSIYNIASGVQTDHLSLAGHLQKILNIPTEFAPDAYHVNFPPISIRRIREEFGFTPTPFECYFPAYVQRAQQIHRGPHRSLL
jgi:nucleoside-diphosphate-sugar epimerase